MSRCAFTQDATFTIGLGCFICSASGLLTGAKYNRPNAFVERPLLAGNDQLRYSWCSDNVPLRPVRPHACTWAFDIAISYSRTALAVTSSPVGVMVQRSHL